MEKEKKKEEREREEEEEGEREREKVAELLTDVTKLYQQQIVIYVIYVVR